MMSAAIDHIAEVLVATNGLCDDLERAASPLETLDAVGQATLRLLGPGLLTINAWHAGTAEIERIWSSNPAAYPPGGKKSKPDSPWRRQLLEAGEVFVGEGDAALAAVFDDVALIRSLGCTAVVNVPLCRAGRVFGTFNYLSDRAAWDAREIATLRVLANLALPAVRT
ncbi:GAF domain-containing protein [Cupriavidus pinatubonensis]|nr:GAF domain-containing protein [Cupriavidus pinatubonensis]